ncbi:hypothetical protein [Oceaniradius stylonematis]|uniref:hypothetical protein n=1 Tax=Oceaniradius stylonematis TaxID=2184161 RepID=UPI0035D0CF40
MDLLSSQINAPSTWQAFEDLICALFAEAWKDPTAQKNGRNGQPQHGVDVYGSPEWKPGVYFGVQCKGKNRGFSAKATKTEFDRELAKAEKFAPTLGKWYFATTAEVDVKSSRACPHGLCSTCCRWKVRGRYSWLGHAQGSDSKTSTSYPSVFP